MLLVDTHEQTVNFRVSPLHKKIVINCSGGADSSLLVYLTSKYIKENKTDHRINILSCSVDVKSRKVAQRVTDIIEYVIDKLEVTCIDTHYALYRETGLDEHVHPMHNKLYSQGDMDILFGGITANPKEPTFVTNSNGDVVDLIKDCPPIMQHRNFTEKNKTTTIRNNYPFYNPFIHVDKRFVYDMYKQFDILDMIPMTRSCNGYYPTGEQVCGMCWGCLERKWALGEF